MGKIGPGAQCVPRTECTLVGSSDGRFAGLPWRPHTLAGAGVPDGRVESIMVRGDVWISMPTAMRPTQGRALLPNAIPKACSGHRRRAMPNSLCVDASYREPRRDAVEYDLRRRARHAPFRCNLMNPRDK